jgi:hypothetical protein
VALNRTRDDLQRLFERLVDVLLDRNPDAWPEPLTVADLHERIIPYRTSRARLGFDSLQDYDMALLRLLAGEREYATVEPREVRESLAREAAGSYPDPGAFRAFPAATVRLNPAAVQAVLDAREAYAPPVPSVPVDRGPPEPPPLPPAARFAPSGNPAAACAQCDGSLPEGRVVLFCPYCGADLRLRECPSCGTALERDWTFCITCGHRPG